MSSGPEGLDWQALVVELNDRRAIYAERFPADLDAALAACPDPARAAASFDQQAATDVLRVFAGAWPTLGPHGASERWHYISIPNDPTSIGVFAFRGRALLPGTIVIDAVHQVRA